MYMAGESRNGANQEGEGCRSCVGNRLGEDAAVLAATFLHKWGGDSRDGSQYTGKTEREVVGESGHQSNCGFGGDAVAATC